MEQYKGTFKCVILSPNSLVYENEITSLFLTGDSGEFEILAYHYPVISLLQQSSIIIDWKDSVSIKAGIVRFFANECIILIEEVEKKKPAAAAA